MFSRNEVAAIHDAVAEVARLRDTVKALQATVADLKQALDETKKRKGAKHDVNR